MRRIAVGLAVVALAASGCASLIVRDTDTAAQTAGKIAARVPLFAATLGYSELGIQAAKTREVTREFVAELKQMRRKLVLIRTKMQSAESEREYRRLADKERWLMEDIAEYEAALRRHRQAMRDLAQEMGNPEPVYEAPTKCRSRETASGEIETTCR